MIITKEHAVHYVRVDQKSADQGIVQAIVAVFGNVDLVGDRIVPGAFKKSLRRWKASGKPIPVLFSHLWQDPTAHVGKVLTANETAEGLEVTYELDLDTEWGAHIFRLIKERRLTEHSFSYDVIREETAEDGANELLELDILELGPTLRGMNPETRVISVKGANTLTSGSGATVTLDLRTEPQSEVARYNRQLDRLASKSRLRDTDVANAVDDLIAEAREERVLAMLAESHAEADFRRDQQAKIASRIPEFDGRFAVLSKPTEYESGPTESRPVTGSPSEEFRIEYLPGGMSPVEGASDE